MSLSCCYILKTVSDEQWARAMNYVNEVSELNYMTQIVIMMYEDPNKVCPLESQTFSLIIKPTSHSIDLQAA